MHAHVSSMTQECDIQNKTLVSSSLAVSRKGGPTMEGFVSHFLSNVGEEKAGTGSLKNIGFLLAFPNPPPSRGACKNGFCAD